MSTDRATHTDDGLADPLGGRVEIAGRIPRSSGERGGHGQRTDLPHDLPDVGSEAFHALNRRRVELIDKEIAGHLTEAERDELERLETACGAVLDRAFPLLPIDLDAVIPPRDSPRAGKEGRGA